MKFKIPQSTQLFEKLKDLRIRMDACNDAAMKLTVELGGEECYQSNRLLAGGIAGIRFRTQPEGWKKVDKGRDIFMPKAALRNVCARIKSLPIVWVSEAQQMLGYKQHMFFGDAGMTLLRLPTITWGREFILLSTIDGDPYLPPTDAVEIMGSEYDRLTAIIIAEQDAVQRLLLA